MSSKVIAALTVFSFLRFLSGSQEVTIHHWEGEEEGADWDLPQTLPFDVNALAFDPAAPQEKYTWADDDVACFCSFAPTYAPTAAPTFAPTFMPTAAPTYAPTASPTGAPFSQPTFAPTFEPTFPSGPNPPSSLAPTPAPSCPTCPCPTCPCPNCATITITITFCIDLQLCAMPCCSAYNNNYNSFSDILMLLLSQLSGMGVDTNDITIDSISPFNSTSFLAYSHKSYYAAFDRPDVFLESEKQVKAMMEQQLLEGQTSVAKLRMSNQPLSIKIQEDSSSTLVSFNVAIESTKEQIRDPWGYVNEVTSNWQSALESGEFASSLAELANARGAPELAGAQPGALSVSNVQVQEIDNTPADNNSGSSSDGVSASSPGGITLIVIGTLVGVALLGAAAWYYHKQMANKGTQMQDNDVNMVQYETQAASGNVAMHNNPMSRANV